MIDLYGHLAVNDLDMVTTNLGSFAYRMDQGAPGLVYPTGSTKTVVFAGGLWFAASRVGGAPCNVIAAYGSEYAPGTLSGGVPAPDNPRFRTYTLLRGDTTSTDYLSWPSQDGAPVDARGKPALFGDQMVWSVFHGADLSRVQDPWGPVAIEVRQSAFEFLAPVSQRNTIFLRYDIVNKGGEMLDSARVGLWLDPDLGDFADDLAGCDTSSAMGFCYNATDADAVYAPAPPAVGVVLLKGPYGNPVDGGPARAFGMTAFTSYTNGTDPRAFEEYMLAMKGLNRDGSPMHEQDNETLPITTYRYSGDPVSGTGWLDASAADRRFLMTAGPFRMAPGDTQVVIAAIVVGQGTDRLSSITDLRARADDARALFEAGFPVSGPSPSFLSAPLAASVTVGDPLQLTVRVIGGGTSSWALSAEDLPAGAGFTDQGSGTGVLDWTPTEADRGSHRIAFRAVSGTGDSLRAHTDVAVFMPNTPPVLDPIADMSTTPGNPVEQTVRATDPDGDFLSIYPCPVPNLRFLTFEPSLGFGESTMRILLQPDWYDVDYGSIREAVTICASDGPSVASQSFHVEVRQPPYPPYLSAVEKVVATVGTYLTARAELADGNEEDSLRIEVNDYPPSLQLTFERHTSGLHATLSGIPRSDDVGTYVIRWTGSDGVYPAVEDSTILEIMPRPTAPSPPLFTSNYLLYRTLDGACVVAAGDFDGDGRVDAALGSSDPPALGLMLADPVQGFRPPLDYLLPSTPVAIATGDWNSDGVSDLAAVCESIPAVQIFVAGAGGLTRTELPLSLTAPSCITSSDLDGDGTEDLIIGDRGSYRIHLLRGSGTGAFEEVQTFDVPGRPSHMAIADFNRDGVQDLACASQISNSFSVVLGPLLSNPSLAGSYITVNFPSRIMAKDLDADGVPDLIVMGRGLVMSGAIVTWLGRGDGLFERDQLIGLHGYPFAATIGDMNGDGLWDLAVTEVDLYGIEHYSFGHDVRPLTMLLGRGGGLFEDPFDFAVTIPLSDVGYYQPLFQDLVGRDLDGDGRDEILLARRRLPSALAVIPGRPREILAGTNLIDTGGQLVSLQARDMDGDGDQDLIAGRLADVVRWTNRGDGSFVSQPVVEATIPGPIRRLASGDWNGDGHTDLVAVDDTARVWKLTGRAGGGFDPVEGVYATGDSVGTSVGYDVQVLDVDEDGFADVLVHSLVNTVFDTFEARVRIAHGGSAGLGALSEVRSVRVEFDYSTSDQHVVVEHGRLDLLVNDNHFRVASFDRLGAFLGIRDYEGRFNGPQAVTGDFDGDGRTDVVVPGQYPAGLGLFPRGPDDILGSAVLLRPDRRYEALAAADFDGDGRVDLAACDPAEYAIEILKGRTGGFAPDDGWVGHGLPGIPSRQMAVGDLNGDGALDLAVDCSATGRIALLFNQTPSAPPSVLEHAGYAGRSVSIVWRTTVPAGSTGHVYRSLTAGADVRVDSVSVDLSGRVSYSDSSAEAGHTYSYRLAIRRAGADLVSPSVDVVIPALATPPAPRLSLGPVLPNPVRTGAVIRWSVPAGGPVRLAMFDVRGRLVRAVQVSSADAGPHELQWDGRDAQGRAVAAGVYWVRLEAAAGRRVTKLVVLR